MTKTIDLDYRKSEKYLEGLLTKRTKYLGCLCLKYINGNETGFPDRLVLLPGGSLIWVELKSAGKKLRPIQEARKKQLESIGHEVYVVDSTKSLDTVIDIIHSRIDEQITIAE